MKLTLRQSLPNKAGLKCLFMYMYVRTYLRTYVCPQHVSPISMKFGMYVEVDERCTIVCSMTRSKVKVTSPSKLEVRPFLKAVSSAIYNGSWQLTTVS